MFDESQIIEPERQLAKASPIPLARTQSDPMDLIAAAIEKGYSPESLNALVDLKHKLDDRAAAKEFNAALVRFRGEAPAIVKRRGVSLDRGRSEAYRYAALEDIEDAVGPVLLRHGFTYTYTESVASTTKPGWMRTTCRVTHSAGHSVETSVELPIPDMRVNETQRAGAAMSYGRRYSLCSALGLRIVGEDDDGRSLHASDEAVNRTVDAIDWKQAVEIDELIESTGADKRKFLAWASAQAGREISSTHDLPQSCFAQAMSLLSQKKAQR